jgi:hypothetical protein
VEEKEKVFMDKSMNAVYKFICIINNGKGMGSHISFASRTVIINDNKGQHIGTFSSDIQVSTLYGVDALKITIIDDDIIRYVGNAVFWTNHYNCELNGSSLEVSNDNYLISIY